ncbi:MAG: exodeoxyribonuclease VII large subunit [Bacilli bacterium]|nr:exodeoxyribonuclease VII large subunit [Bacilli bacterium]
MAKEEILTVTELNTRIKVFLEGAPEFHSIRVSGEISNFKRYPSGHCYFTLKDDKSVLPSLMWQSYAYNLKFNPQNGDKVVVIGSLTVYPPQGGYRFSAVYMEKEGEGEELAKLRALAAKLKEEGLFDESRKRKIPPFPNRIGVIAGKSSAGMKDILHNASLRWPLSTIVCMPSLVQGKEAPKDLLRALKLAENSNLDVLIIGRGGGSSEDLGAFNDETLVRAVASCEIPVISAVGHEIDTTLIDLVADRRVSTPTAAAVLATPDQNEVIMALDDTGDRLLMAFSALLRQKREKVASLSSRPFFLRPGAVYEQRIESLEHTKRILIGEYQSILMAKKNQLDSLSNRLKGLSPEGALKRGYSISQNKSGKVIASIKDAKEGEEIITHLKDGIIESKITAKKENRE